MKKNVFAAFVGSLIIGTASPCAAQSPAEEMLDQGRSAYMNYDFDEAARLYANARKKAGKKATEDFLELCDLYNSQLTMARNFLERVEKIQIIDSISVPKADFFKAYRIPASSGFLGDASHLPAGADSEAVDYVFTNEGGDYKLWAAPDSTDTMRLMEAIRLTDGSWHEPTHLADGLSEDGDALFPFMMADGVTLYYADNGSNSMGGYDIMVATRDAADGEFLQPQNLGMPYNSPYDDYLLAIDELNGVGWWATDRNQLGDNLTLYVFKVNDLRQNYDPDEEELISYARVDDYILTQEPETDYDELLETIRAISPEAPRVKKVDFMFPMGDGVTYCTLKDFKTAAGRSAMKNYLAAKKEYDRKRERLTDLRKKFHKSHSSQTAQTIASLEQETERDAEALRKLRSDVYKAELKK